MQIKAFQIPPHPVQMTVIKKTNDTRCWQACEREGTGVVEIKSEISIERFLGIQKVGCGEWGGAQADVGGFDFSSQQQYKGLRTAFDSSSSGSDILF